MSLFKGLRAAIRSKLFCLPLALGSLVPDRGLGLVNALRPLAQRQNVEPRLASIAVTDLCQSVPFLSSVILTNRIIYITRF